MRKLTLALVGLVLVAWSTPVVAQDWGDLANAPGGRSGMRSPADVLKEIDGILNQVYAAMGNRYEKVVDKNTAADSEWQGNFQNWNGQLTSLWNEFYKAVDADVQTRKMDRDNAFRQSMQNAYMKYRQCFGAVQNDPTRKYSDLLNKAGLDKYTLRITKKWWADTTIGLSDKARGVSGWSDPTQWTEAQLAYAIGLMPQELLNDVNKNIQAAYFYGYLLKWYKLDPNYQNTKHPRVNGLVLDWDRIDYRYYMGDDYYYRYVYTSNWLYRDLANQFRATQPKTGTTDDAFRSMDQALAQAEAALQKAEAFIRDRKLAKGKKGEMTIDAKDGSVGTVRSDYEAIVQEFGAAMESYKVYLDQYRNNFPGRATGELQNAMRQAFDTYRQGFTYNEVDGLLAKFETLAKRGAQFKLTRKGFGAFDKTLAAPSWYSRPRKELYSAQRVVTLLPTDFLTKIDDRRESAFLYGTYAAQAEFNNAQDYKYGDTKKPESYTYPSTTTTGGGTPGSTSNTGQSDWGTQNNGGNSSWGNGTNQPVKPTSTTGQSDWGTPAATKPAATKPAGTGQSDWGTGSTTKPTPTPTPTKKSDW